MVAIIKEIKNKYSIIEIISLCICLIRTKIICRKARLIRQGFILRGKKMVDLGIKLTTGRNCRIEAFLTGQDNKKKIIFGKNIQINDNVHISALSKVTIGDDVLIASNCYISDNSHGVYKGIIDDSSPDVPPSKRDYLVDPVSIGKKVWIGEGVIIMPGVNIGEGCVVGAHSVVNKDIPSFSIVAGSPAKIIKTYNFKTRCWDNKNK